MLMIINNGFVQLVKYNIKWLPTLTVTTHEFTTSTMSNAAYFHTIPDWFWHFDPSVWPISSDLFLDWYPICNYSFSFLQTP